MVIISRHDAKLFDVNWGSLAVEVLPELIPWLTIWLSDIFVDVVRLFDVTSDGIKIWCRRRDNAECMS